MKKLTLALITCFLPQMGFALGLQCQMPDVSNVSGILPVANGGTGSSSANFGGSTVTAQSFQATGQIQAGSSITVTGNIVQTATQPEFKLKSTVSGEDAAFDKPQGTGTGIRLLSSGGAAELLRVTNAGNLGIGTANPVDKLHISSAALINFDGNGDRELRVKSTSGSTWLNIDGATDQFTAMRYSFAGSTQWSIGIGISGVSGSHLWYGPNGANKILMGGVTSRIPSTFLEIEGDFSAGSGATKSTFTATGQLIMQVTASQTIAAGNTVAADACGGIKQITAGGAVTTDTTNTFTAPGVTNSGCCMDVINVGTANNITLDANANFNAAADIVMTPCDVIRVCSNGVDWFPIDALVANTCN